MARAKTSFGFAAAAAAFQRAVDANAMIPSWRQMILLLRKEKKIVYTIDCV